MRERKSWKAVAITMLVMALPAVAFATGLTLEDVGQGPAHSTTADLTQAEVVALVNSSSASDIKLIRTLGLLVFSTPFNNHDGHGDGPFDPVNEPDATTFGHRPTLQGSGQFLRLNGLDAQACNECHGIVKNSTLPPTLGMAGVGSVVQSAFPLPSLFDIADSGDDRVSYVGGHDPDLALAFDGEADYNGRFINPPFLYGGGGTELLGKEMTADLQQLLAQAKASPAGTVISLDTHGVNFGSITSLGGGDVELHPEGIGPVEFEHVAPEEVLVVRPFGRKGENFSMRDFDRGAMQFHFGIQAVEVVGENVDEDGDGHVNEVSVAEMSALHIFDTTNPVPVADPLDDVSSAGFQLFQSVGCSGCHMPTLETRTQYLPLAHPEVASDPSQNVYTHIDLVKVGFKPNKKGGVSVPFFADLKRHKMGPRLAEDCERCLEIANDEFTTARLWGIADTAPYLHDGRATTLWKAIEFHGGEAQSVRDAFLALPESDQATLIAFLRTLRTPDKPNEELF